MNDPFLNVDNGEIVSITDVATILYSGENWDSTCELMNKILAEVADWLALQPLQLTN